MTGLPATRPQTADAVDDWLKALSKAHTPVSDVIGMLEQLAPLPGDPIYTRVHQQHALWLSKFSDLPAEMRHESALQLMRARLDLGTTEDRETLGIAGGICKRMWQDDGRRLHLDRALVFYTRGHNSSEPGNDYYTSINAAYLEAMIAEQELLAGFDAAAVAPRYTRASAIYSTIVDAALANSYVPKDWWTYATVAEAYLGLGKSSDAAQWLANGIDRFKPTDKDRSTTLRQLAHLIQLQSALRGEEWREMSQRDLTAAFNIDPRAVRGAVIGKVGLALSGGGFRASLYHVGVFALLAELDLLRHVEVLSCVSGGSIIGAQYYLELRHRLEEKTVLTRADYIEIVHNLETKFLEGVQTNIRTSAATDLRLNLRMLFDADYSRTERVAELYDEELFAHTPATLPLYLNELKIVPPGFSTFNPKEQNWSRASKVPILILNATSLNTGHQWQFTAAGMGEPPYTAAQIDAVEIFPLRAYGADEKILLSRAVAASSGVPGLFSPLVVHRDGRAISLVDGGVHDNQGVASLLEQECKTIIVSDASGQLKTQDATNGVVAPPLRSNSILQARLREAQIKDLLARRRAGLLQGFTFVHMTMGLENAATAPSTTTEYDVRHDVQKLLAEMRTDLDSFNDAEAYALMMSGYRMITYALKASLTAPGFTAMASDNLPHDWDFLRVAGAIDGSDPRPSQSLFEILSNTGAKRQRKKPLLVATIAVVVLLPLLVTLLVPLALVITLLGLFLFVRYRDPDHPKPFDEFVVGILLATAGWVAANVYLDQYEPAERKRGAWPKR